MYECEKTKYILENRRKWLNNEITQLLVNIPNFENSSYYKEYNKQKKIYKEQVAYKNRTTFKEGIFTGAPSVVLIGGAAIAIIYDIYALPGTKRFMIKMLGAIKRKILKIRQKRKTLTAICFGKRKTNIIIMFPKRKPKEHRLLKCTARKNGRLKQI